jgi:hypothetical protein
MTATSGWDSNVVNAMVRSLDYDAKDAALISATSCERCWNVLLHHYYLRDEDVGDDHGYPIGSDEEALCGTSCILCDQVTEMCSEERVSCCGMHTFIVSTDGKHWMCSHCEVPGVELNDLTLKRHIDAGGEPLAGVVSETVYKYKVRGRTDKYPDSGSTCDASPPSCSSS